MLKSRVIQARPPGAWAEHNSRMARADSIGRELEATFPHKFRHPRIGRQYIEKHGVASDWRKLVRPAIFGYKGNRGEPTWLVQALIGILIVATLFAGAYAASPLS